MATITRVIAQRVAQRLVRYGFEACTAQDVLGVARGNSLDDSALESAILQELEELGLN